MSNNDLGISWADEADDDEQETHVSAPQSDSPAHQSSGNSNSPTRQSSSFGDDTKLTLFVNNIPYESSNETVRRFFEDAGCKVVRSWVSGKGSGNVVFEDIQSLQTALSLQDQDFGGRNINIKPARPSQKRDDFRRGGDQRRNNNNNSGRPDNRGDGFKRPYDRRGDDQNRRNNNERRHDNREERGYDNRTGGSGGFRRDQNSRSPTTDLPTETPVDAKERPKLQLLPRTVAEVPAQVAAGSNKSNPFGAARPREIVLEERKKLVVGTESPQDAQPGPLTSSTEPAPSESTPASSTSDSTPAVVESKTSETTPSPEQGQEEAEGEFQEQGKQKPKQKPKQKGKQAPQQTQQQQPQQQQQQQQKGKQNNRAGAAPTANPKAKPKPTQQGPAKPGDKKKGTQNIYAFLGESSS